jgi:hypothetical protein
MPRTFFFISRIAQQTKSQFDNTLCMHWLAYGVLGSPTIFIEKEDIKAEEKTTDGNTFDKDSIGF